MEIAWHAVRTANIPEHSSLHFSYTHPEHGRQKQEFGQGWGGGSESEMVTLASPTPCRPFTRTLRVDCAIQHCFGPGFCLNQVFNPQPGFDLVEINKLANSYAVW